METFNWVQAIVMVILALSGTAKKSNRLHCILFLNTPFKSICLYMPGSLIFKCLRAGVNVCKPDQQNLNGALSPEEHRTYKEPYYGDGEGVVETVSLAGASGVCSMLS